MSPPEELSALPIGIWPRALGQTDFRVLLSTGDDEPEVMFESHLEAGWKLGWTEGQIDLASHTGESVSLILETAARGEPDLSPGVPVWANPEALARIRVLIAGRC